jgi:hypothetical protein
MGVEWIMPWRVAAGMAVCAWVLLSASATVRGEVALMLVPTQSTVNRGELVEIGLFAVSDDGKDQALAAMDVVLTWDPSVLGFDQFEDSGPVRWLLSGFLGDSGLDGLNNTLDDGDGMYTALSGLATPALVTPAGLLVTTFRFTAIEAAKSTEVRIETSLGNFSTTRIFGADFVNQLVTGELTGAKVEVRSGASISAPDLTVPRGSVTDLIVLGEIIDLPTFGVTVVMELVPEEGASGVVEFTRAAPVDIVPLDDPWPGAGLFSPFDTDLSGSPLRNGLVDDNGTLVPTLTSFSGALGAFPVWVDEAAEGVWRVELTVPANPSGWEDAPTLLKTGFLRPVDFGDGNGDGAVDLLSVAEFQCCFSGDSGGMVDRPAFDTSPERHCAVYDRDADRDVDLDDFGFFRDLIDGPASK